MKDLFNEPILSLNDLLSVWSENNQKATPLFKNFENLAKSKLGIKSDFNITKKEIEHLYQFCNYNSRNYLHLKFTAVFKKELEVGKVYKGTFLKNENPLIFIDKINEEHNIVCYGFQPEWFNQKDTDLHYGSINEVEDWQPATTEEWVEAIKKECEKRGLKENNFKCLRGSFITKYITCYDQELDRLWTSHGVIYEKGIFATPIPILTKKEAEEKLNCIIE